MNRSSVTLKTGDQASFSCSGLDQYGQSCECGPIEWSAKGGNITADGVFAAGSSTGLFKAKAGQIEAVAEVKVQKDDPTPPPPPPGKRTIRWLGNVPPQKWMNYYTKVLSKFATIPELKLTVSFEVPVEHDHAESKAEEAQSDLLELGLDDDVSCS